MPPLFIARGTKTDCTDGARQHVIGVFLVSLYISAEFKANVFAIVKVFAGQEITRRKSIGCTVGMRKSVEPEHCIGDKAYEHDAGNTFKRKGIIAAASPVFHSANVPLDFGNMFILGTKIETNLTKGCLERFKFRVGESGRDAKSPTVVDLDNTGEASCHGGNLTVRKRFDRAEVESP